MQGSVFAGFALIVVVIALSGCETAKARKPEFGPRTAKETADWLPFLRDGVTTKAEVVARLGKPDGVMEDDRTWFYSFVQTTGGGVRPAGIRHEPIVGLPAARDDIRYFFQLVLTFDAGGRLIRHTMIEKPDLLSPCSEIFVASSQ